MARGKKGEGASGKTPRGPKEPTLREEIEASGETEISDVELAEREAREDHLYLAREFLTWLVHHADVDGGAFEGEGDIGDFTLQLGNRITLRTPLGFVTDVVIKGPSPGVSADVRYALAGGMAVKEAELRLEMGDRAFTFALAAEHFDLKRAKLPDLLSEEDDERGDERLLLLGHLDGAVALAFARFLSVRIKPEWTKKIVPAMRAWLDAGT